MGIWIGTRHQSDNFIQQKIVDALPFQRMYVSQTLFELVLGLVSLVQ